MDNFKPFYFVKYLLVNHQIFVTPLITKTNQLK